MRLRRYGHPEQGESHGIDLAPMLDFVLNLLIFFIITAVFVKELGITVNRAGGSSATPGGAQSIPITITATGDVYMDGRVIDLRAVRANVERAHAVSPKSGVLVIADHNAATGLVVEVVDQVHQGGIYNISFGTAG